MTELRPIEIDFEVYKRIESARRSFLESHNDALRRLLGVKPLAKLAESPTISQGRSWRSKGVELLSGTLLRMEYNGVEYTGEIVDGEWIVEGKKFNSPSGAAIGVAKTRTGISTHLNGWNYWYVKRPGEAEWIPIKNLIRIPKLSDF